MKTKPWLIAIAVLAVLAVVLLVVQRARRTPSGNTNTRTAATNQQETQNPSTSPVGSVAGVDLNDLGTGADQSASLYSQDGTSDVQSLNSAGSNVDASLNNINDPAQQ